MEGVATLRTVVLGHRNGLRSEVTSGLEAGEQVLTHPSDQVSDGTSIRFRD
ncbi:MAG: hypothetical protein JKY65_27325 [Planctomycetes bacterium]|nr:hypothetical protein [Planctomycetota bacterium]